MVFRILQDRKFYEIPRLMAKYSDDLHYKEFTGGYNGLEHRLQGCNSHSDEFVKAFDASKNLTPPIGNRALQDINLFGFFVSGLSALECFGYCLHFMASFFNPTAFQTQNLRAIILENTSKSFNTTYSNDRITISLNDTLNSPEFEEWTLLRNILAHRASPGRNFSLSTNGQADALWQAGSGRIALDRNITTTRLTWLKKEIEQLTNDAFEFVVKNL